MFINALGYHPPRVSIVYATLGNYAVNFLLPRAGDVWRCGVVSKYDKIPLGKTVETFLVDKMIDILAGLTIIFVSMVLYVDFFISYFKDNPELFGNVKGFFSSPWFYLALGALVIAMVLPFTLFKGTTFMKKVKGFLATVKYDLKVISGIKEKKQVIIYTILLWFCFYLYFYICFSRSISPKTLGQLAGLIVFAMTNIVFRYRCREGLVPGTSWSSPPC